MADLVLDYALLHELAGSMRDLKAKIQMEVDAGSKREIVTRNGTVVSPEEVGPEPLFFALSMFFHVCHGPFKDAMELLDQLAENFDAIAKAFFDVDADFAGKVNTARLQSEIAQWQADTKAYEHYQNIKDKYVTYQLYDENGNLVTERIPLWGPDTPPPEHPGSMPTSINGTSPDGSNQTVATRTDENGNIISETTTVNSGGGLTYTETTNYSYHDTNGDGRPDYVDYTSTVTHSDGTTETITKSTNPDGSFVVTSQTDDGTSTSTVTPKPDGGSNTVTVDKDGDTTTTDITVTGPNQGTKTVIGPDGTYTYRGNPDTDQWTLESHNENAADDTATIDRDDEDDNFGYTHS